MASFLEYDDERSGGLNHWKDCWQRRNHELSSACNNQKPDLESEDFSNPELRTPASTSHWTTCVFHLNAALLQPKRGTIWLKKTNGIN